MTIESKRRPVSLLAAVAALVLAGMLGTGLPLAGAAERAGSDPREPEASGLWPQNPDPSSLPPQDPITIWEMPKELEAVGSLGPPIGWKRQWPAGSTYPHSWAIGTLEGPSAQMPLAPHWPAAPRSALPGDCSGGTVPPGSPCGGDGDCGTGGTCVFSRIEVYRNETGTLFSSTVNPAMVMDDLRLAGALPAPPARITSVEWGFVVPAGGIPAGTTLRTEIRFWDTLNTSGTAPSPINTDFLGGVTVTEPGPIAAGQHLRFVTLPLATAIVPADPDLAIELKFLNHATGALGLATVLFAGGPVNAGSSLDIYWRDANGNGVFDATDARQFGGPPTLSNFYLHLGAQPPVAESEPNNSPATATWTTSCLGLNAAISPVGDVDWYRFTVASAGTIIAEVACGSAGDDSTLALKDSAGATQLAANDDISVTNRCSRITASLAPGTYTLEVREKGDDAQIPSYRMEVGPPPERVTGLRVGTPCSPTCADKTTISWNPLPAASSPYDLIFGDLRGLKATGLGGSVSGCLADNRQTATASDFDTPSTGEGRWYLARGRNRCTGGAGTYDGGGPGQAAPRDPSIPLNFDCGRP